MKKNIQRLLSALLALTLVIGLLPLVAPSAEAFTPAHDVIRVGLNAFRSWQPTPNVRLANDSGLRIGYFDGSREFVPSSWDAYTNLTITASGNMLNVTTPAGALVFSGTTIAIAPVNPLLTSDYILPNAGFGGNVRANFELFGGFNFTVSNGLLTVINYVDLEDYVKGVVPYEMPADWPIHALMAQAITARTYAARNLGQHNAHGFDVSNSIWCQVYRGMHGANANTIRAVTETRGMFILHNGSLVNAVYHATSGGATENSENVWVAHVPYLRGVPDEHGTLQSVRWSQTLTAWEFLEHMRRNDANFGLPDIVDINVTYTEMGNVLSVQFVASTGATQSYYREATRNRVNTGFHPIYNSQRFTIERNEPHAFSLGASNLTVWERDPANLPTLASVYPAYSWSEIIEMAEAGLIALDTASEEAIQALNTGAPTWTITNYGFGHNVGMSQWGARAMAADGYTFAQIIQHYYTGVTITGHSGAPDLPPPPPPPPPPQFTDVGASAWYHGAVAYVRQQGLMQGTSATTFSPQVSTTRGMFVTILGRMAGINTNIYAPRGTVNGNLVNLRSAPQTVDNNVIAQLTLGTQVTIDGRTGDWFRVLYGGQSGYLLSSLVDLTAGSFGDVAAGAFYAPYVAWAHGHGIVDGFGDGSFRPAQTINRQQMATMLWRYAQEMGIHLHQTSRPPFQDLADVAPWARTAVEGLQGAGIIQGTGEGLFQPEGLSNRASVAQMIANFHRDFG